MTGRTPPRAGGSPWDPRIHVGTIPAVLPPLPLPLLLCGGQSSGVYRCPGRQLGVLRFALRETVAFLRLFRPLALRTPRYRIFCALALSTPRTRLGFSPKGALSPALSLRFLARFSPCDLNLAYIPYNRIGNMLGGCLITRIYFSFKNARVQYVFSVIKRLIHENCY